MASLASIVTGNFTTAGTWGVCDATSENDSVAANTALTTSYVASTAFTPGVITIDAIAVKVATVAASPTGTMSIELYNSTLASSVAIVTINVSDIAAGDTAANGGCGWYFFSIGSTLLIAATNYQIRAKTSSSSQVNLFSSATTNWSRQLRTTTTGAPAASDKLFIQGQWTAAATSSSYVVTNDNTATTIFGAVAISNKGTLTYGITAATNYYLKCLTVDVFDGATFKMGTTAARMPADSTGVLEFNSTTAAQYGLNIRNGGTFNFGGDNTRVTRTFLTADEAAAQTVIGPLVSTTGWRVSDELAFPSTTRSPSQSEKKTILTVDSGTQVTLTAGLTNAHSGTNSGGYDTRCEVANLTRNIRIRGVSSTSTGYIDTWDTSTISGDYLECYNLGTTSKGVKIQNTTGSCSIENSSFHDMTVTGSIGVYLTGATGTDNIISIKNNVFYDCQTNGIYVTASSAIRIIDGNYVIKCAAAIVANDVGSTYINNKTAGNSSTGMNFNESAGVVGTFTGHTSHSNGGAGLKYTFGVRLSSGLSHTTYTGWRNTYGVEMAGFADAVENNFTLDTYNLWGNSSGGAQIYNNGSGDFVLKSWTCNAGVTLTQPKGLDITVCHFDTLTVQDSSFGATTAHATGDIFLSGMNMIGLNLYNTTLSSTGVEVVGQTGQALNYQMYRGIWSIKENGVAGAVKNRLRNGTISLDTVLYRTLTPSLKCVPLTASFKQPFANKRIPIVSGGTVTVSVYVWKSAVASGDSANYNGNQPRLMVRKNLGIGITADAVIATASGAAGAWELLTGTCAAATGNGGVEFFIDCDGTVGFVSVDDFTTTATNNPSGMKYWFMGIPNLDGGNTGSSGGAGGSFTFS